MRFFLFLFSVFFLRNNPSLEFLLYLLSHGRVRVLNLIIPSTPAPRIFLSFFFDCDVDLLFLLPSLKPPTLLVAFENSMWLLSSSFDVRVDLQDGEFFDYDDDEYEDTVYMLEVGMNFFLLLHQVG